MFRATVFDYNGVLVDDEHLHLAAFQDVLRPFGIALSEADYWEKYLGFDDAGAFEAVLKDAGHAADVASVRQLIEAKQPLYLARAREKLVGFPGAAELVQRRAAHGPVVIVSGALRPEIDMGLTVLGVKDSVLAIVSAEDTERSKPDPEGYVRALDILRGAGIAEPTRDAFVIEDSVDGVQAARAAGLVCVGVCHSYAAQDLTNAGANSTVATIADVTTTLLDDLYARTRAR